MRLLDAARLVLATILFLTASLAVFRAPTHFSWMVAIGATEWGHALALICLGAAVPLWNNSWSGRVASGLCVVAAVLAISPLLRAARIAGDLPARLAERFGHSVSTRPSPLVYLDLFRGISLLHVQPETLVYEKVAGTELSLDFYRAQAPGPAPLLLVIHAGSWQGGDNKDFIPMDQYFATRGFAVADVLYRLAPQWRFPAALSDVRAAIEFLRQRADSLKIDPNCIVLIGRSAGGQIALAVAYSAKDPGIRGVISFYAPTDLQWSWKHPGNPLVLDTRRVLADYLGGSPSDVPSNYDDASPVRLVTSEIPPTLLFHGDRDELVSSYHSSRLDQLLAQANVRHLNVSLPWATHAFDYILRGPGGQISIYAMDWFLRQVTR